jgi:hypothetical protein
MQTPYGETEMTEQIPFGTTEFADNPEPRCPCLLLLDVSGSMKGQPITELNAGLTTFKDELAADALAMKRVEVGIVTFGPVDSTGQRNSSSSLSAGAWNPNVLRGR